MAGTDVHTLTDYVSLVESSVDPGTEMWYRGIGNPDYPLVPGLYRHEDATTFEKAMALEAEQFEQFADRSPPFDDRELDSSWHDLFYMQHYGFPTRLLDWSQNPLVALYFAVEDNLTSRAKGKPETDAVIWMLNPTVWNEEVTPVTKPGSSQVFTMTDDSLTSYRPPGRPTGMWEPPVAMRAPHNSRRIVAQRGTFVVFGSDLRPMEDLADERGQIGASLQQVRIPEDDIEAMSISLISFGYSESVIFPDMGGLARELRIELGFGR